MKFQRFARQFSAAEVQNYFGVPEITQRDWRRKFPSQFRPAQKGKRFMFDLSEACALAIAKVQADAGKGVEGALTLGKLGAIPAIIQIELQQDGVFIDGIDMSAEEKREFILRVTDTEPPEDGTRYLFMPSKALMPSDAAPAGECFADLYMLASLTELEDKGQGWSYASIFDLQAFARRIVENVPGPIVTYRRVEVDE